MQKNYFCEKKGFTLIEILVVILIIGVLATIAVPKYQKTVWKSRSVELLQNAKALNNAKQVYALANGTDPTDISALDLSWPGFTNTCSSDFSAYGINSSTSKMCLSNDDFIFFIRPGTKNIVALFSHGPYSKCGFFINGTSNNIYCYEIPNKHFCAEVLGCKLYSSSLNYNYYFTCPGM